MGERYKMGEIGGYIVRARCIDKGIKREKRDIVGDS